MKTAFKLAFRNLIGAGLRTWLNVIVLSFSFVVIIWMKGLMAGWDYQAKTDMTSWQIGEGQYWHELYDPYDPFTLSESHAPVPEEFKDEISQGAMEPLLVVQGTLYPGGRMQPVSITGISPGQKILKLPTHKLDTAIADAVPAVIGNILSQNLKVNEGDRLMLRWRDVNGMFDATEILITAVFSSNVPAVEASQVYLPLEQLRAMTLLYNEATFLPFRGMKMKGQIPGSGFINQNLNSLLRLMK
jgi:putative ABC transport system permease protein